MNYYEFSEKKIAMKSLLWEEGTCGLAAASRLCEIRPDQSIRKMNTSGFIGYANGRKVMNLINRDVSSKTTF